MTTRPTAPQSSSTPLQLSLVAAVPMPDRAPTAADADARAWQIGRDHARHGLALPAAHLHAGSPLYAGWCAGQARRSTARHRDPAPGLRSWLLLRLQAWCEGLDYDDALLTPNYLRQLEAPRCPVTRQQLVDEQGDPRERVVVRLLQHEGYRAGHLVQLSRVAAQALQGRSLTELQQRALLALRLAESLDGLTPSAWARLASLVAYVTPSAEAGVQRLLPPNRLRLAHPEQALQAWLTRQLLNPGWSQRLQTLTEAMPSVASHQAARLLTAVLAPHALCLPTEMPARLWMLEDMWTQDARLQRRWLQLVALLSPLTLERLLQQLPAPAGWVVEQHASLLAA